MCGRCFRSGRPCAAGTHVGDRFRLSDDPFGIRRDVITACKRRAGQRESAQRGHADRDRHTDQYPDEYTDQHTHEHADQHTNGHADQHPYVDGDGNADGYAHKYAYRHADGYTHLNANWYRHGYADQYCNDDCDRHTNEYSHQYRDGHRYCRGNGCRYGDPAGRAGAGCYGVAFDG